MIHFDKQHGEVKLLAAQPLNDNTLIGTAFVVLNRDTIGVKWLYPGMPPGVVPTPIGGFLEHSDRPNCMLVTLGSVWQLWTISDILPNYPLSIDKRLYGIVWP